MSVIVVGGGMAGTACAAELGRNGVEVTLVDRHDYTQFQPLLYQVATSQLPAEDIARPLATMFRDQPPVTVVTGEVTAIDVDAKTVTTDAGTLGPADHLVVAAGSQPNFFGVPGAAEHAFPLYSVRDAERLRTHLRDRLRELCTPRSDGALNIVICGGGPTGVEIAGLSPSCSVRCGTRTGWPAGRRCGWSIMGRRCSPPSRIARTATPSASSPRWG